MKRATDFVQGMTQGVAMLCFAALLAYILGELDDIHALVSDTHHLLLFPRVDALKARESQPAPSNSSKKEATHAETA